MHFFNNFKNSSPKFNFLKLLGCALHLNGSLVGSTKQTAFKILISSQLWFHLTQILLLVAKPFLKPLNIIWTDWICLKLTWGAAQSSLSDNSNLIGKLLSTKFPAKLSAQQQSQTMNAKQVNWNESFHNISKSIVVIEEIIKHSDFDF